MWEITFPAPDAWRDRFAAVPYEDKGGSHPSRYYQDIAVERVLAAIAAGRTRILLTLATGTGKTFIAFQIAWRLFQARWNRSGQPSRRPRILFLADRNILANQAFNAFSAFPEDALVRIKPEDLRKKGKVPKNGSLFFTIFQTFMASTGSATGEAGSAGGGMATGLGEVDVTGIREAYGYMYVLECSDGSFYVGSTRDLRLRLQQQDHGQGSRHTAARRPAKLVYYECFDSIDKAFQREQQVQGWSRARRSP